MVASPNYGLFRYDGDGSDFGLVGPDGSDEIEAIFARYYAERSIPSEPRSSTGGRTTRRSSTTAFRPAACSPALKASRPPAQAAKWGGTAGVAYDPCYHAACDTIANLSQKALRINADAIAYAVYLYASGGEVLNDREGRKHGSRSAGPFA